MATLIAPAATVTPPARVALPGGLDSVLSFRSGDRWESGIQWSGIGCGPIGGRGGPFCDPADVIGLPKPMSEWTGPGFGEASPFVVYGAFNCNPIGGGWADAQPMAETRLFAGEIARAEQALWTGDLGSIPNLSGANGYDAPVSAGSHDTEWHALAAVEDALGREYGSVGTIHMSRRTASLLLSKGSLEKSGGRINTKLGTPVVAGAGYPDVPEIIGTAALFGYRGDVITSSDRPGDLLDRASNTLYAIAEREYIIGFDPCPVIKATYTGVETP